MLDAIEATGIACDGRFLALNSYENRVYQIGTEDGFVVAKFYRPNRWSNQAIIEEHRFTLDLADLEIPVIAPNLNEAGESLLEHQSNNARQDLDGQTYRGWSIYWIAWLL